MSTKGTSRVMLAIGASRVLGLVREVLLNTVLGAAMRQVAEQLFPWTFEAYHKYRHHLRKTQRSELGRPLLTKGDATCIASGLPSLLPQSSDSVGPRSVGAEDAAIPARQRKSAPLWND